MNLDRLKTTTGLDVAGKRGASTTAGIVDGVGYVGASLAAFVLGSVSQRHGWSAAFDVIAAVTAAALLLAATWWRVSTPPTPKIVPAEGRV